ncbi:MAG: hypothetical protein C7B46_15360 [Sulfobacillus benefaciens]|uniref:Uncharacterized protein n=1 Tax=Sulfobacillus benefaciens TaxID=453960 RepID=A0A2T2XCK6_9FIRM|nr:MAG: hypothetical protein C7B46_15360 [Sulfobacillus benefaciens]
MPLYYHVTPQSNLGRIFLYGLVPQCGTRSADRGDAAAVYLFRSAEAMQDALLNWFGDLFDDDTPLNILAVRLPAHWPTRETPHAPWEVSSLSPIPPRFLQYLGDA